MIYILLSFVCNLTYSILILLLILLHILLFILLLFYFLFYSYSILILFSFYSHSILILFLFYSYSLRYDKTPSNLLSPVVLESPPGVAAVTRAIAAKPGPTKSATHNMSLLSRYLHHRRWIWAVQPPSAPAVPLTAVARILNTLTRLGLE